jgi:hypothetical protein
MGSFSASSAQHVRVAISLALFIELLGAIGCTGYDDDGAESEFVLQAEAVALWAEPDSALLRTSTSVDMEAESRSVVWIADRPSGGVFRIDPVRVEYRTMGAGEDPPEEIMRPLRISVSRQHGVFVFDWVSRRVDQFTPDGIPIQSFEPGFVPVLMDVVEHPIGMQFAAVDAARSDSIPRLVIIRTGLKGERPDTVLYPGAYGPEALWSAAAERGHLALDASSTSMWVWAMVAADTAFEVTHAPTARKRVLRPQDRNPQGILVDSEREILWVVSPDEEDRYRYAAYDIRTPGLVGTEDSYLGERTTTGLRPKIAKDGVVIGRVQSVGSRTKLAAYDMLVPLER